MPLWWRVFLFATANGGDQVHRVTHIELVVVDVETDTGVVGTGISHTSGVGGWTIMAMIGELSPELIGFYARPAGLALVSTGTANIS